MKKYFPVVIIVTIFFIGLSVLLYPVVSDLFNQVHQTGVITAYEGQVAGKPNEELAQMIEQAQEYNRQLYEDKLEYSGPDEMMEAYNSLLSLDGSPVMAYLNIPKIEVNLPVYHGVSDEILQVGVGHIRGYSLPVGGENTHSILSAHRGLPSIELFSRLDALEKGDKFTVTVLDQVLYYEVDDIQVIEPKELDDIKIIPGQDYVTLLTCTPYGVNTHRLLVRGVRTDPDPTAGAAFQINKLELFHQWYFWLGLVAVLMLALLVFLLRKRAKRLRAVAGTS